MLFYEDFTSDELFDLHTAANIGDPDYFHHVKTIAKINEYNAEGWTALMYAAARGAAAFSRELVKRGALHNFGNLSTNVSPLMLAVLSGDQESVEVIARKEDLNRVDVKGWSALFYAVFFGRETAVNFLITQGADVNLRDLEGRTPLILAVKVGIESIVEKLLESGANPKFQTPQRETAISLAKLCGNPKMEKIINDRTPKTAMKLRLSLKKFGRELRFSPNQENIDPYKRDTPKKDGSMIYWLFQKDIVKKGALGQEKNPVLSFLKQLGLEKYWPMFRDEEVDFETLLTFEEKNLTEIGIRLYGPRRKIFVALQDYKRRLIEESVIKQKTFI